MEYQINSTRHFMRELNRLGITSAIDAGGGFQNYPDDYKVINDLAAKNELTVRIAYNLFTQKPKQELADFQNWTNLVKPGDGSDFSGITEPGRCWCSLRQTLKIFRAASRSSQINGRRA